MDMTWFEEMESRIPQGEVRTRFAPYARPLRRLLSFFLLFALVCPLSPAARAETLSGVCGAEGDNLIWTLEDGVLTVSGKGAMADYSDAERSPWGTTIKKVHVEEGVTSIGEKAFFFCMLMDELTLPEGLERIGTDAFGGCICLTAAKLPEGLESIGVRAFCNVICHFEIFLVRNVNDIANHADVSACRQFGKFTGFLYVCHVYSFHKLILLV